MLDHHNLKRAFVGFLLAGIAGFVISSGFTCTDSADKPVREKSAVHVGHSIDSAGAAHNGADPGRRVTRAR
jgi:hypothetical protein